MYTPNLPEALVRRLYQLKLKRKRPMTLLIAEAVEIYLNEQEQKLNAGGNNDDKAEA